MGRTSYFPTILDSVKQISLKELKEWGYLKPDQIKAGTVTFSRYGQETGTISITVNTMDNQKTLSFKYTCNGEDIEYDVTLVSTLSNIGKGLVCYFRPYIFKRCRKLYLVGGKVLT